MTIEELIKQLTGLNSPKSKVEVSVYFDRKHPGRRVFGEDVIELALLHHPDNCIEENNSVVILFDGYDNGDMSE